MFVFIILRLNDSGLLNISITNVDYFAKLPKSVWVFYQLSFKQLINKVNKYRSYSSPVFFHKIWTLSFGAFTMLKKKKKKVSLLGSQRVVVLLDKHMDSEGRKAHVSTDSWGLQTEEQIDHCNTAKQWNSSVKIWSCCCQFVWLMSYLRVQLYH